MAQIKLSGDQLKTYASEIINMGSEFETVLNAIHAKVDEINNSWDGLAADNYAEMYTSLRETLANLVPAVEGIGKTVDSVADTWIETEQKLASANG